MSLLESVGLSFQEVRSREWPLPELFLKRLRLCALTRPLQLSTQKPSEMCREQSTRCQKDQLPSSLPTDCRRLEIVISSLCSEPEKSSNKAPMMSCWASTMATIKDSGRSRVNSRRSWRRRQLRWSRQRRSWSLLWKRGSTVQCD